MVICLIFGRFCRNLYARPKLILPCGILPYFWEILRKFGCEINYDPTPMVFALFLEDFSEIWMQNFNWPYLLVICLIFRKFGCNFFPRTNSWIHYTDVMSVAADPMFSPILTSQFDLFILHNIKRLSLKTPKIYAFSKVVRTYLKIGYSMNFFIFQFGKFNVFWPF